MKAKSLGTDTKLNIAREANEKFPGKEHNRDRMAFIKKRLNDEWDKADIPSRYRHWEEPSGIWSLCRWLLDERAQTALNKRYAP